MLTTLPLILVVTAQTLAAQVSFDDFPMNPHGASCEKITVPLCKDRLYNYTRLPNGFGHDDQEKVNADILHYQPLVQIKCSPHVHFFICALFTPMCDEGIEAPITACRSVCEKVQKDCTPSLQDFGFTWPDSLNCSRLPTDSLCMNPDGAEGKSSSLPDYTPVRRPFDDPGGGPTVVEVEVVGKGCEKRPHHLDLDPNDPSAPCVPRCGVDIHFQKEHKEFAEIWMAALASVCALVTGVTIVTCLMDRERFRFPQRSIVFLALCYFLYSWAFLLRVILGYERSACQTSSGKGEIYLVAGDLQNPLCVLVFILLYYFGLARSVWWVVLTFTWYLAARKKWSDEAIENWNSYYHLAAWGVPALLSIAVLITRGVDSSELTGLCMVGNQNYETLGGFLVLPHLTLLLLGALFLLLGWSGLRSVQNHLRHQGYQDQELNKLERLKQRIAVFSLLYVIPTLVLVACLVYHMVLLIQWRSEEGGKPRVEIYMLQIFMDLIVGITSGMWIFSRKTCVSWKRFCCCCFGPPPSKGPVAAPLITTSDNTTARLPSPSSARTLSSATRKPPFPVNNAYFYHPPSYLPTTTASSDTSRGF